MSACAALGLFALSLLAWRVQRQEGISEQQNPLGQSEQVVAQGRELYNRSCTLCHGHDGAVGDRGPALAGARSYLRTTNKELFEAIRDGIRGNEMPPSGLPEESIWKIVAYLRSLRAPAYEAFVKGDVARGGRIFSGKGRCGDCHMVRGEGGFLGPDLSNAGGQRTLQYLREALSRPRSPVPKGYQPVKLITAEGERITGIVKNEDDFSLQLLSSGGTLRLFTRDELREVIYQKKSLMPADYDQRLSPQEFEDLLAFLSRQAADRLRREQIGVSEP